MKQLKTVVFAAAIAATLLLTNATTTTFANDICSEEEITVQETKTQTDADADANAATSDKNKATEVKLQAVNNKETKTVNETKKDEKQNNKSTVKKETSDNKTKEDSSKNTSAKDDAKDDNTKENIKASVSETIKNKWQRQKNGCWSYYGKDGKPYTGWHYMGKAEGEKTPHWSYFDKNGCIYTGWHYMGKAEGEKTPHWSYFGSNGWLRTGWVQLGKGTSNPDGNAAKHWSYFGSNGWLRTGWIQLGKGTSEPDGNKERHWSYFGANGWLKTNSWYTDGNGLHYFNSSGWMQQNQTTKVDNAYYSFDNKGIVNGVEYKLVKYVNQLSTYGYYPMGCGAASGLMAAQSAGYITYIDTKGEWNQYLSVFKSCISSAFGSKIGLSSSSLMKKIFNTGSVTKKIPITTVNGSSLTTDKIKDALTHGQTVTVIIRNYSTTHWIAITGWYKSGNNLIFRIADPYPNDGRLKGGSKANTQAEALLGDTMSASVLSSKMNDIYVRVFHNGKNGVFFGNYKKR